MTKIHSIFRVKRQKFKNERQTTRTNRPRCSPRSPTFEISDFSWIESTRQLYCHFSEFRPRSTFQPSKTAPPQLRVITLIYDSTSLCPVQQWVKMLVAGTQSQLSQTVSFSVFLIIRKITCLDSLRNLYSEYFWKSQIVLHFAFLNFSDYSQN